MSSFDGIRVAKARHRPSWLWLACNCLLTADVLESPCRAVSFSVTGRDICPPPGNLPSPKTTIADIFGCPLVRDRVRLGADVRDSIFGGDVWRRCLGGGQMSCISCSLAPSSLSSSLSLPPVTLPATPLGYTFDCFSVDENRARSASRATCCKQRWAARTMNLRLSNYVGSICRR